LNSDIMDQPLISEESILLQQKRQKEYQNKRLLSAMVGDPFYEFEVEAYFLYQSGICGERQQAYLPIVGASNNGAILHYIANDMELTSGDMLLIDAGGEYWGYGCDITRTYPVNGKFTASQRLIYDLVLKTQTDVVASVRAGVTFATLNSIATSSITNGLLAAGLIQGTIAELTSNSVFNIFYMHSIGHSLGLDVHDSQTSTLAANQVITVEPGIYFNDYLLDEALRGTRSRFIVWDKVNSYRGSGGVRIEDDYIVTATGSIKITLVPSDVESIEKIMQSVI